MAAAWMTDRLVTTDGDPPAGTGTDEVAPATATELAPLATARPALRLAAITISTRGGTKMSLTEARSAAVVAPLWISLEVAGTPAPIHLAVRIQLPGRPGITIAHGTTRTGTPVRLDLTALPQGEHQAVLVAWTDNGSATPTAIPLPRLSAPTTAAVPPS